MLSWVLLSYSILLQLGLQSPRVLTDARRSTFKMAHSLAIGRRARFSTDSLRETSLPHHMDVSIGLLEGSRVTAAGYLLERVT